MNQDQQDYQKHYSPDGEKMEYMMEHPEFNNPSKEILAKYDRWCEGKDEGWIYDEIGEFFNTLGRGELLEVISLIQSIR